MRSRHRFEPSILRAYDIRGVVGETLGLADAEVLGRAFGSVVQQRGGQSVALGFDGRVSSPDLATALALGMIGTGVHVLRIGRATTPMLNFAVHHLNADAGIIVTGSHNPQYVNGFKMVIGDKPFFGTDILALADLAAAGEFMRGRGRQTEARVLNPYVEQLLQRFDGIGSRRIAWDAGNGAAGEPLVALTRRLSGEHALLNEMVDGTFPNHHPDPAVPENLEQLRAEVTRQSCTLGVAFDGDGDRLGVVDERGEIVWPDELMVLFAHDVLRTHPGAAIIADVKSSQTLFDEIARAGGQPLMWKTGHAYIKAKLRETGALLAGEMSGHIFFADRYYGYDDALYAVLRLLAILDRLDQPLSELRARLPVTVKTPEIRFPSTIEHKREVVDAVANALADAGAEVVSIDGVRATTEDGWCLLRASNTEDALIVRCEAGDMDGLERLKALLSEHLTSQGIDVPRELAPIGYRAAS